MEDPLIQLQEDTELVISTLPESLSPQLRNAIMHHAPLLFLGSKIEITPFPEGLPELPIRMDPKDAEELGDDTMRNAATFMLNVIYPVEDGELIMRRQETFSESELSQIAMYLEYAAMYYESADRYNTDRVDQVMLLAQFVGIVVAIQVGFEKRNLPSSYKAREKLKQI